MSEPYPHQQPGHRLVARVNARMDAVQAQHPKSEIQYGANGLLRVPLPLRGAAKRDPQFRLRPTRV